MHVDPNDLDTMTVRLNATGGKVDAVGQTVANVNVGPQSMGIVGGNFTGAAQSHLKTAQQHVKTARLAVDNARAGTTATATRYREREQTTKVNLEKAYKDPSTTPTTTRPSSSTTTPASTTKPAAKASTPPTTRPDAATVPLRPDATTKPDTATVPLNNQPGGSTPGSIGNRLNPPPDPGSGTTGPWQQSTSEQNLQNAQITGLTGIGGGGNVNEAFKATLDDGSHAVYKPASGEDTNGIRQDITSDLGRREVAASRVDEMLGFGRVPTTAWTDGVPPHGPGSLQQFAEGAGPSLDSNQYSRQHQQQMAVIDYINGNTDRHTANYMTAPDGSPVAIDNGFSFPDGERDYIRSDFVRDWLNFPLDQDIVDAVRAVDPNEMRRMLEQSGLGPNAVDLTLRRLDDIQTWGKISGLGWRGEILDANWGPVRGPMP